MPYATEEDYQDVYLGTMPNDIRVLSKALLRASEIIDILTNYKLVDTVEDGYGAFTSLRPFVQNQVMKANCALAEHYIILGGYDALKQEDGLTESYIGDFRITKNASSIEDIPETVISMLSTTGLLYAGIKTSRDDGLYYNGWWI